MNEIEKTVELELINIIVLLLNYWLTIYENYFDMIRYHTNSITCYKHLWWSTFLSFGNNYHVKYSFAQSWKYYGRGEPF